MYYYLQDFGKDYFFSSRLLNTRLVLSTSNSRLFCLLVFSKLTREFPPAVRKVFLLSLKYMNSWRNLSQIILILYAMVNTTFT